MAKKTFMTVQFYLFICIGGYFWTFRKCGNLRICNLRTQSFLCSEDLTFANPNSFCGLKTFANSQIHKSVNLYKYSLKP